MKQTINELWCGNIRPCDETDMLCIEKEPKAFIDTHRDFMDSLDDKKKDELMELLDSLDKVWSDARDDAFEKGFSLATRLISEALTLAD